MKLINIRIALIPAEMLEKLMGKNGLEIWYSSNTSKSACMASVARHGVTRAFLLVFLPQFPTNGTGRRQSGLSHLFATDIQFP